MSRGSGESIEVSFAEEERMYRGSGSELEGLDEYAEDKMYVAFELGVG